MWEGEGEGGGHASYIGKRSASKTRRQTRAREQVTHRPPTHAACRPSQSISRLIWWDVRRERRILGSAAGIPADSHAVRRVTRRSRPIPICPRRPAHTAHDF